MQDKEVLDQCEEALSPVGDTNVKKDDKEFVKERTNSVEEQSKKESSKDGKFAFRKMKQPKKEKSDKKKATRFEGEGISFKAKYIGVEIVLDARGDDLCQEAMQRLKVNVKNLGPHKRKINIFVSLQGIKIKDDKTGELLYHHPVSLISFISQDITDARAFGYVFGSTNGQHQFIAIKTEKPAFHVVVALRDLFQTVLNIKQEKMDLVKENKTEEQDSASSIGSDSLHEKSSTPDNAADSISSVSEEEKSTKGENIYFDVILAEPFKLREPEASPSPTVDDLLGLQDELNKLQLGIQQMDTSIAAAFTLETSEKDPFDTSFITPTGPKMDAFTQPMPEPIPAPVITTAVATNTFQSSNSDRYAAFSVIDTQPSIFENASNVESSGNESPIPELKELEEEIKMKSVGPAKPPRTIKTPTNDLSIFADLDPLGKDRPYKDKAEFFQDVKNPPKKVLNDLVDKSNGEDYTNKAFDVGSPVAFPMSPLASPSGVLPPSLPKSLPGNFMFSAAHSQNGNPFNPFDGDYIQNSPGLVSRGSDPTFQGSPSPPAITPPNGMTNGYAKLPFPSTLSNGIDATLPIPIPNQQYVNGDAKGRTYSNGSGSSSFSKSPSQASSSPADMDDIPGDIAMRIAHTCNGTSIPNGHTVPSADASITTVSKPQSNGVSRPRPRPSLNKGTSLYSNGITRPTAISIVPPPESEMGRRQSVQTIPNQLRVNGHRLRTGSLPVENRNASKFLSSSNGSIFTKEPDPFSDDFFCSVPKKVPNNIRKTEIREYV